MGRARGRLSCFCWRNSVGVVEPARKEPLQHPEKCSPGQCPNDTADPAKRVGLDDQSKRGPAQQAIHVYLMQPTAGALEVTSRESDGVAANATEKPADGEPQILMNVEQHASAGTQDDLRQSSTQVNMPADVPAKNGNESPTDDNQRTASQETTTASDTKDVGGEDGIALGVAEPFREASDHQSPVHGPSGANHTAAHPTKITNEVMAPEHPAKSEDKKSNGSSQKAEENESGAKVIPEGMRGSKPRVHTVYRDQTEAALAESKGESEGHTVQRPALKESSLLENEAERSTPKAKDEREQPLEDILEKAAPRAVTDDGPAPAVPETQATVKDIDNIDTKKSESSQDEKSSCGQKERGPDDVVSAVTTNSQATSRRNPKKKKSGKAKGKRRHGRTGRR